MKIAVPTNKVIESAGKDIMVRGFVHALRAQSKIAFIILRDIHGTIQGVVGKESSAFETAKSLNVESVIEIHGLAKKADQAPGGVEIEVKNIVVLSAAAPELPIPVVTKKGGEETEAPIRFDYRWIDLRKPEKAKIFKVWTELERGFRQYWLDNSFIQLYPPSFMNTPSETGAQVFEVKYFKGKAYLAQSPQFYKQMGIASGFERVFMVAPIFRAEESFTTRHLTEFTGWDFEMAYIESHHDIMDAEEGMIISGFKAVKAALPDVNIDIPTAPFPRIPMVEAKKILKDRGIESGEDHDLSPEEERAICEYVKEKHGHDFVFITDYHKSKSAFYHMRHEEGSAAGPDRSKRADLLYRGIEVTTLAQREHRVDILERQALDKGMSLDDLKDYMNFFRYGCPPHGGAGIGPARLIMKMLDLPNVREATYLPRDVKRLNP
ncbi:MAG TPA: aspartate--tRNA(Asn) ligase [Candidatus Paceibacterota bacterium]|nr:aspartate--tRNA(Asn) ligase [Candidatus Paceibacterota bacterium]